jgi:hypothetical protein
MLEVAKEDGAIALIDIPLLSKLENKDSFFSF